MSERAETVLVTGGAGFIGSELVRQLIARRLRVIVVDNLVNGRRENLPEAAVDACELVVADIRDRARADPLLRRVSRVFHLACLGVRQSIHSPILNHAVNATATLELLVAARAAAVDRFVYVSSSEVYGAARWAPMSEEHPTFPTTVYGVSKLAGESYTRAFNVTYGYPTVVVRPFNAYGPRCHHEGDSGEVIPKFMLRGLANRPMVIFGDGTQTRDFTFVADTARGIVLAGLSDQAVGCTVNIGSGQELSIRALAEEMRSAIGVEATRVEFAPPRPGDVPRLCADTGRARALFGFEPTVPLQEGLRRLREWYAACGIPPSQLLEAEWERNWEPSAGGL